MNCSVLAEVMPAHLDVEGLEAIILDQRNGTTRECNEVCAAWGIENPDFYAIPAAVSDVPMLLLSGELDPNTPPCFAAMVAEGLSHDTAIAFPGLGHQIVGGHPCPRSIALAFLDDPASPLDTIYVQDMRSRFISEPIAVACSSSCRRSRPSRDWLCCWAVCCSCCRPSWPGRSRRSAVGPAG